MRHATHFFVLVACLLILQKAVMADNFIADDLRDLTNVQNFVQIKTPYINQTNEDESNTDFLQFCLEIGTFIEQAAKSRVTTLSQRRRNSFDMQARQARRKDARQVQDDQSRRVTVAIRQSNARIANASNRERQARNSRRDITRLSLNQRRQLGNSERSGNNAQGDRRRRSVPDGQRRTNDNIRHTARAFERSTDRRVNEHLSGRLNLHHRRVDCTRRDNSARVEILGRRLTNIDIHDNTREEIRRVSTSNSLERQQRTSIVRRRVRDVSERRSINARIERAMETQYSSRDTRRESEVVDRRDSVDSRRQDRRISGQSDRERENSETVRVVRETRTIRWSNLAGDHVQDNSRSVTAARRISTTDKAGNRRREEHTRVFTNQQINKSNIRERVLTLQDSGIVPSKRRNTGPRIDIESNRRMLYTEDNTRASRDSCSLDRCMVRDSDTMRTRLQRRDTRHMNIESQTNRRVRRQADIRNNDIKNENRLDRFGTRARRRTDENTAYLNRQRNGFERLVRHVDLDNGQRKRDSRTEELSEIATDFMTTKAGTVISRENNRKTRNIKYTGYKDVRREGANRRFTSERHRMSDGTRTLHVSYCSCFQIRLISHPFVLCFIPPHC